MGDQNGYKPFPKGFATAAIHYAQDPEKWDSLAVVPPIVTASTFKQDGPANPRQYEYSRSGNPTRDVLENVLARLDNGKYGLAFSSGLGASVTVLGLLKSGDHMIVGDDVYGGINRIFNKMAVNYEIEISLVDFTNLADLERSIKPNTKLVWTEMPTNPMMRVVDLQAVADITKQRNIILVVDNTFLTPYLLRPLEFGVDVVSYSLTKYMNGHSDVVMGALVTSNEDLYERLKYLQNAMGIIPSPFDCYQVNRGLKTLALRMKQHSENATIIAKYLEKHPKVEKVIHPGLPSHPQHELFKKQTSGHSGTFSFYIKGDLEATKAFLNALKLFTVAESLGGYESLIEIPSIMTHTSVPVEHRLVLGITDNLVRVSVGIEDVEDLVADLEQAFEKI